MGGAGLGNYDEAVAAGWHAFFASLPQGARLLDLCTGNGAIALIALEAGRRLGTELRITGVDRAAIDPPRFALKASEDLKLVDFRGGVRAEQLPFADSSFDVVVSQYGFEYTNTRRSAAELARVLASGGQVRLLTHAADGKVAASARNAIRDADFLLSDVDLPGAAARCLEALAEPGEGPAAAQSVKQFETALARTATYLRSSAEDQGMVWSSASILVDAYNKRSGFDLATLLDKTAEVRTEILAHKARLAALVEAALDDEGLTRVACELEAAGLSSVRHQRVEKGSDLIGFVIEARAA